jgi:hypothetical protein
VGKNWKPVYRIQFYSDLADNIVRMILPYLVVKREQANLYLELRARMKEYKHPLSAEERATRASIWLQCKQLNQRGIDQAERLSEEAPQLAGDDAIVRTASKREDAEAVETAARLSLN